MLNDIVEFLPDTQSINQTKNTDFVLFCNTNKEAKSVQLQLSQNFNIHSILDIDDTGVHYVIPLEQLDDKIISNFICRGWNWDRNQKFVQYLITLYNKDVANKIYTILLAYGYNVILLSNNMQLFVKCLENSSRNIEIQKIKSELEIFEKTSPKSIDDYFNKILFNGVIENPEYHKINEQKFDTDTIKQNKDLIIREILYQYFNKKIRAYLICKTFPKKFNANKLDNETIQNINLVRNFLYSVATEYVDAQIEIANQTKLYTTIRFNYFKTHSEYNNFQNVLKLAKNWQRAKIKNNRIERRNIRMSQRWAYKLMDLNNGYYVVYLGAQEALDYENHTLKHRTEIYYNDDIYEGITRYSIRKEYTPLLTLELNNDKIVKCYGYNNIVPVDSNLREAVRLFMHERNLTIPDNKWNKLIAYIKQNGVLYDIFNLPANFIVNTYFNLEDMGLDKIPYMPTATVQGNLLCHGNNFSDLYGAPYSVSGNCDFSQNPLTSLYGMPRHIGGLILLSGHKLTAESFVPNYIENKLNDILGVDKKIIDTWKKQIESRKNSLQSTTASFPEKDR